MIDKERISTSANTATTENVERARVEAVGRRGR